MNFFRNFFHYFSKEVTEQKEEPSISFPPFQLISENDYQNMLSQLECLICKEVMYNAMESECCGVGCCESCTNISKLNSTKCPQCRKIVIWKSNKLVRKMISELSFICPDCSQTTTRSEWENHKKKCTDNKLTCKYPNCTVTGTQKEIEKHDQICGLRFSTCKNCKEDIRLSEMEQHVKFNCLSRFIICELCETPLEARQLKDHRESECSFRVLSCTICEEFYTAFDLESHFPECQEKKQKELKILFERELNIEIDQDAFESRKENETLKNETLENETLENETLENEIPKENQNEIENGIENENREISKEEQDPFEMGNRNDILLLENEEPKLENGNKRQIEEDSKLQPKKKSKSIDI